MDAANTDGEIGANEIAEAMFDCPGIHYSPGFESVDMCLHVAVVSEETSNRLPNTVFPAHNIRRYFGMVGDVLRTGVGDSGHQGSCFARMDTR